jgi:hypothetical protein
MKGLYKDCMQKESNGTFTLSYRTQYRLSKKYTFFQTRYKEQFADGYWRQIKQSITKYLKELKTSDQQHGEAISKSITTNMMTKNEYYKQNME